MFLQKKRFPPPVPSTGFRKEQEGLKSKRAFFFCGGEEEVVCHHFCKMLVGVLFVSTAKDFGGDIRSSEKNRPWF